MNNRIICVVKYGSSVLQSQASLPNVVADIGDYLAADNDLIIVVSAFDGVTDRLIAQARRDGLNVSAPAYAAVVGQGEYESARQLREELRRNGAEARIKRPRDIGFIAEGQRDDAQPLFIDRQAITNALREARIVVVPGFSAVDREGDPVLLGRGGSDLTAIQIAHSLALNKARLVKDVDGVYDRDPNQHPDAQRLTQIDHGTALSICGDLIQAKALQFALEKGVAIEVTALGSMAGTTISRP